MIVVELIKKIKRRIIKYSGNIERKYISVTDKILLGVRVDTICRAKRILLYGAAKNAENALFIIETLFPGRLVGIAVSQSSTENGLMGYKVESIDHFDSIEKNGTVVIVAMRPDYYRDVRSNLRNIGFSGIYSYGDNNALMNEMNDRILQYCSKNEISYSELKNKWNLMWLGKAAKRFLQEELNDTDK